MASEKKLDAAELDRIYKDAEQIDSALFAEMRSNLLLVAGEHYQKQGSKFHERLRDVKGVNEAQKLRLTKNHVKKITDTIAGVILTHAPNTTIVPNNPGEVQDQKTAELNKSVWEFYKKTLKIRAKLRKHAHDFVNFGETACKIFFDNSLGDIKGYAPIMDEQGGIVLAVDTGEPQTETIMTGNFVIERILAPNLLRDPQVQDIEDSPYIIIRKLIHIDKIKDLTDDEEVISDLQSSSEESFLIFDSNKNSYTSEKNHVIVREHYYRPCKEFPKGYLFLAVQGHIIKEMELPFGIWPIVFAGYDEIPTSARYRSPIKQMRPYQVEINRAASHIATTQVTLGDPKLILQNGSKMTSAGILPGVRAISVTGGMAPTILPGQSGDHYAAYMMGEISELYRLMNVEEAGEFKDGKLDPYALLYFSMRNRSKFLNPGETFEEFAVDITDTLLKLAKEYLEPDMVIPMVGKSEMVNIPEFKNTEKNCYRIQVEAVSTDTDSMLGKQLAINHTLQYVGNNLDKQDIGRMIRAMPFMNAEEAGSELTINYDNSKNDILALERGEMPSVNPYDDHKYVAGKLAHRMKQADFRFLAPQIQQAFADYKGQHEQLEAQQALQVQRAKDGYIPTDGYMVKCDFYIQDANGKSTRASIPYMAIDWLLKQLEAQGQPIELFQDLNQGVASEISQMMTSNKQGTASPSASAGSEMQGEAGNPQRSINGN